MLQLTRHLYSQSTMHKNSGTLTRDRFFTSGADGIFATHIKLLQSTTKCIIHACSSNILLVIHSTIVLSPFPTQWFKIIKKQWVQQTSYFVHSKDIIGRKTKNISLLIWPEISTTTHDNIKKDTNQRKHHLQIKQN